jgi:hypothetical protein
MSELSPKNCVYEGSYDGSYRSGFETETCKPDSISGQLYLIYFA